MSPYLENLHQYDLVRIRQVDFVLGINHFRNLFNDIVRFKHIVVANSVSNSILHHQLVTPSQLENLVL